ncbi:pheromone processing endoprotease [Ceratobasidium sp. 428]|nr:pheromone processing endoprotease [Ceratobasidium sp. 428]
MEYGHHWGGCDCFIVGEGLDYESEVLSPNFLAEGPYDYNNHEPLPGPNYRTTSVVHAVPGRCLLRGTISAAQELRTMPKLPGGSLGGGRSTEAPGSLVEKAVANGVQKGGGGKGSVFVFASGNGAGSDDQCNFDGYINSMFSVTVTLADIKGSYLYCCKSRGANMIVAYSSGGGQNIHTSDIGKRNVSQAMEVLVALLLSPSASLHSLSNLDQGSPGMAFNTSACAQPYRLTRPIQTGNALPSDDSTATNTTWNLVKPQAFLELKPTVLGGADISRAFWSEMKDGTLIPEGGAKGEVEVTAEMMRERNFEKLEHITIKVWITHTKRGHVEVELVSPKGIKSVLAAKRRYDQDEKGFPGWRFMTLKHWDEDPVGKWTIRVSDQHDAAHNGSFLAWSMSMFGSVIDPSKVELWTVPDDPVDPATVPATPITTTSTTMSATATKQHPKPTEHLPGDHDTAEGEAHKPSFNATNPATGNNSTSTAPVQPEQDEGYFSHMTDLLESQTWLFAALGAVVVFVIGAGVWLYRRRRSRMRDHAALGGDDVPMSQVGGATSGGIRELCNAFGELSDGESEADEEAAMRRQEGSGRTAVP